ncbi:NADH-FMN oxidoreductase RutF, flavin reductase (DIM6/NTAB) family [Chishuiella changwenlii]|jgi:flavin reductase (DIM6/NTAB) family NADH-FMN oxidoreductase RutF|uniref:Flavin reductase n=1 Tax=Chishuiella changwenlii TaxID=1434701 RepID=A0A1M6XEK5_9FLAO|nr:flavin reductase family protein [Chishuiella changwenlii]GGF00558.1 flavin reductase [Chishuiella changwenlii]SHL04358.1 NADH-FMN oxidoreductase RutF, flavin reductase (DIM6/NTAB) family [Chishuiella changwenlii]
MLTKSFEPNTKTFNNLIKHAVSPRPICFASTIDKDGNVNLSPFSFFNLMGQNPPICVFSPLRKMRDGSTKHTLDNILEHSECVINIVDYNIVQQQSLASVEYPKGVNEFEKAGLTAIPSEIVKPPRVAESPFQLECKVRDVISITNEPGAANLIIAEIVRIHVREELLDENENVSPYDLDLVARLGDDFYSRLIPESIFEVAKPTRTIGLGIDNLPTEVKNSKFLTGNNLGQLGNVETLPTDEMVEKFKHQLEERLDLEKFKPIEVRHQVVAKLLEQGDVNSAWFWLLMKI